MNALADARAEINELKVQLADAQRQANTLTEENRRLRNGLAQLRADLGDDTEDDKGWWAEQLDALVSGETPAKSFKK